MPFNSPGGSTCSGARSEVWWVWQRLLNSSFSARFTGVKCTDRLAMMLPRLMQIFHSFVTNICFPQISLTETRNPFSANCHVFLDVGLCCIRERERRPLNHEPCVHRSAAIFELVRASDQIFNCSHKNFMMISNGWIVIALTHTPHPPTNRRYWKHTTFATLSQRGW